MAEKVAVVNLTPWPQGFRRINNAGHIAIPAYGRLNIEAEEVISQCYAKNNQFVGIDERGSHARLYIEDENIRREFEFETETVKQKVLTDEKMAKLFEYKRMGDFEKNMKDMVKTLPEGHVLVEYIKKHKINDYDKIKAVQKYTGIPIE